MPLDRTKPIGTCVLEDEDWCRHCKQHVEEWKVYLEYDGDVGDEQIHRCPHCNAKAHRDTYGAGCFSGLIGSWVGIVVTMAVFPMDEKEREGPAGWIIVAGMFAGMFLFAWLTDSVLDSAYKRQKKKWEESQPVESLDRQSS